MHFDPQRGQHTGRVFLTDFETETGFRPACQPLRREGAPVIRQQPGRDAIFGEQVGEHQPRCHHVFAFRNAPRQEFAAVHVLDGDDRRATDAPIGPAHENIGLVTVDIDQFHRMQVSDRADLCRQHPPQCFLAFPVRGDDGLRHFGDQLTVQRLLVRQRQAQRCGELLGTAIAGHPGRLRKA